VGRGEVLTYFPIVGFASFSVDLRMASRMIDEDGGDEQGWRKEMTIVRWSQSVKLCMNSEM